VAPAIYGAATGDILAPVDGRFWTPGRSPALPRRRAYLAALFFSRDQEKENDILIGKSYLFLRVPYLFVTSILTDYDVNISGCYADCDKRWRACA
jgi:hypothetical protein